MGNWSPGGGWEAATHNVTVLYSGFQSFLLPAQARPLSAPTPAASIGSVLLDTAFQNVEILPSAPLLNQLVTILLPLSDL